MDSRAESEQSGVAAVIISRIEIRGYRRLAATATNIHGRLTAFVGFNEAGKTSLLQALVWFSRGGNLSSIDQNRSRPPEDAEAPVVKVYYHLQRPDHEALAGIRMEELPQTLVVSRSSSGKRFYEFQPRARRPSAPFITAIARLDKALTRLRRQFEAELDEEAQDPHDWANLVATALRDRDRDWPDDEVEALRSLADWLRTIPPGLKNPRDGRLAAVLDEVEAIVVEDQPIGPAWNVLSRRLPEFTLFREADRLLQTSYEMAPDQRNAVDPAVHSLLLIAGIDLDALWSHVLSGDTTKRESLLERGNDRLEELFSRAWNQAKVTVRFRVNNTRLEIFLKELAGDGAVTNISERSDGLRTFVALVAFLESESHSVPPVLLIDEAETHLHYDAQADLVSVLLRSIRATQVFYTTHSPGCLPSDLGTGIRVITRDPSHADASVIKSNFWQGEGPGFSPLLFAMGAGAAAFSVCRYAVLAEGAADMVLLPSLIRAATGLDDLEYQVAPGLATAHASGIRVEEVAAKVVYLVDGNGGGHEHAESLLSVGVEPNRVFRMPASCAVEDLLQRKSYIDVVNGLLEQFQVSARFGEAQILSGVTVSKALTVWAAKNGVQIPSKVEIAYALLESDLQLTATGRSALRQLHSKFVQAFGL